MILLLSLCEWGGARWLNWSYILTEFLDKLPNILYFLVFLYFLPIFLVKFTLFDVFGSVFCISDKYNSIALHFLFLSSNFHDFLNFGEIIGPQLVLLRQLNQGDKDIYL